MATGRHSTRTLAVPKDRTRAVLAALILPPLLVGVAGVYPLLKARSRRHRDVTSISGAMQTLKRCIADPAAWNATIRDPKNQNGLRCAIDSRACPNERAVPIDRLMTVGPQTLCIPGYDLANPATGLTEDGVRCDGFTDKGNSKCPYRVELTWVPHCAGDEKACITFAEEVIFALAYRPTSLASGSAPPFGDGIARSGFGDRQTFSVVRGEETSTATIVIAEVRPPGVPGGPCPAGPRGVRRVMNTVLSDPEGRAATARDGSFWFGPGEYDCRLSTPGYQVGPFRSFLIDADQKRPLLTTTSEYTSSALIAAQTRAVGTARLTLRKRRNHLAVVQACAEEPGGPPNVRALALGVPAGIGSEVYSILDCQIAPPEGP